jgi:hypothetical protein
MSGKLQPNQLITHHFELNDILQAYKTFRNPMREHALKVVITNNFVGQKLKWYGAKHMRPVEHFRIKGENSC